MSKGIAADVGAQYPYQPQALRSPDTQEGLDLVMGEAGEETQRHSRSAHWFGLGLDQRRDADRGRSDCGERISFRFWGRGVWCRVPLWTGRNTALARAAAHRAEGIERGGITATTATYHRIDA